MKTVAILAVLAVVTEGRFEDVKAYETFDASSCVASSVTKAGAIYADALTLTVPFHGEDLTLDLTADRALFGEDWQLIGGNGEIISSDKEAFMCHYTGTVAGKKGSRVTISVCNEAGINGLIETEDFNAEIQPVDPNVGVANLGSHIIYDVQDLVIPDDIKFGEEEFDNYADIFGEALNATDVGVNRAYVMNMISGSDSRRMGDFSSASAEASDTQSIIAQMNNRYTSTSWGSGNSLRIVNNGQRQNANFGSQPSNPQQNGFESYGRQVATYKGNNYPNADNLQGLTSYSGGGYVGWAYCTTMCQRSNSAGINNVGWSTSKTLQGTLVAHEAGHNFGMRHDNNNRPNVMESSMNRDARRFSNPSVNDFNNRSPKGCL